MMEKTNPGPWDAQPSELSGPRNRSDQTLKYYTVLTIKIIQLYYSAAILHDKLSWLYHLIQFNE